MQKRKLGKSGLEVSSHTRAPLGIGIIAARAP